MKVSRGVHTTGSYLYDTESGDLEVGQYAAQSDSSYIEKPYPFISSTSTPEALNDSTPISDASTNNSSTSAETYHAADAAPAEQATTSGQ
jgi:hypothetical protein